MNRKLLIVMVVTLLVTLCTSLSAIPASAEGYDTVWCVDATGDDITGTYASVVLYQVDFDAPVYETTHYSISLGVANGFERAEVGVKVAQLPIGQGYSSMRVWFEAQEGSSGTYEEYEILENWQGNPLSIAVGQNGYVWQAYYNIGNGWVLFASYLYEGWWYGRVCDSYTAVGNNIDGVSTISVMDSCQYQVNSWSWYDLEPAAYGPYDYNWCCDATWTGGYSTVSY